MFQENHHLFNITSDTLRHDHFSCQIKMNFEWLQSTCAHHRHFYTLAVPWHCRQQTSTSPQDGFDQWFQRCHWTRRESLTLPQEWRCSSHPALSPRCNQSTPCPVLPLWSGRSCPSEAKYSRRGWTHPRHGWPNLWWDGMGWVSLCGICLYVLPVLSVFICFYLFLSVFICF